MTGQEDGKKRVDQLLVEKGLVPSRARAQELVKSGLVMVDGQRVAKPSQTIDGSASLVVTGDVFPWVSRGGVKLDHALKEFCVSAKGRICLDLGSSTGGFTDVLLHHGAAKVYAVDVGHGQLHEKLRNDARIVSLEGVHAKEMSHRLIPENIDLIVCDVSFISLTKVLPFAVALAGGEADLVALVKPQFEVGKGQLGKGGIVKDEALRRKACHDVQIFIEQDLKWDVQGIVKSPVAGGDGNQEYLISARNY